MSRLTADIAYPPNDWSPAVFLGVVAVGCLVLFLLVFLLLVFVSRFGQLPRKKQWVTSVRDVLLITAISVVVLGFAIELIMPIASDFSQKERDRHRNRWLGEDALKNLGPVMNK